MVSIPDPNVSAAAVASFQENRTKINELVVRRLLEEDREFDHLGDRAAQVLATGFEFTSAGIETCLKINDASLLVDQLQWARDRLPHDGISMPRMTENMKVYHQVILEVIPAPQNTEIAAFVQDIISAHQQIMEEGN